MPSPPTVDERASSSERALAYRVLRALPIGSAYAAVDWPKQSSGLESPAAMHGYAPSAMSRGDLDHKFGDCILALDFERAQAPRDSRLMCEPRVSTAMSGGWPVAQLTDRAALGIAA